MFDLILKNLLRISGVEGFEPPNSGTKNRSLTTWPRPIRSSYYYVIILVLSRSIYGVLSR